VLLDLILSGGNASLIDVKMGPIYHLVAVEKRQEDEIE
jgi:hypothetical protein